MLVGRSIIKVQTNKIRDKYFPIDKAEGKRNASLRKKESKRKRKGEWSYLFRSINWVWSWFRELYLYMVIARLLEVQEHFSLCTCSLLYLSLPIVRQEQHKMPNCTVCFEMNKMDKTDRRLFSCILQ